MHAVDCDTHIWEPLGLWRDFGDPSWRDDFPTLVTDGDRLLMLVDGVAYPAAGHAGLGSLYEPDGRPTEALRADQHTSVDPAARLARMDALGVLTEVIHPTVAAMGAAAIRDGRLAAAHARAYNRFVATIAHADPRRLRCAFQAPLNHPGLAVTEIEHACDVLGLRVFAAGLSTPLAPAGVASVADVLGVPDVQPTGAGRGVNPGHALPGAPRVPDTTGAPSAPGVPSVPGQSAVNARGAQTRPINLSDPALDPVWAVLQDRDVTICFQGSSLTAGAETSGFARATTWRMLYLSAHVVETQLALADLILGGVLDRFPRLRFGLHETHLTWIPGWLRLLDERFGGRRPDHPGRARGQARESASELFRRSFFVSAFPDEPSVRGFVDVVGAGNLLFASDWPHRALVPATDPDWVAQVRRRDDLTPTEADAALAGNARRWLP